MQATKRVENVNMRLVSTVDTFRYNRSQESELANYNLIVVICALMNRGANLFSIGRDDLAKLIIF